MSTTGSRLGRVEGQRVIICDTPVDVFPYDISPIVQDAFKTAKRKKVEGVLVRVASVEHLILEALRAGRRQDRERALLLNSVADRGRLRSLLRRLDLDGTLRRHYTSITRQTP